MVDAYLFEGRRCYSVPKSDFWEKNALRRKYHGEEDEKISYPHEDEHGRQDGKDRDLIFDNGFIAGLNCYMFSFNLRV